MLGTTEGNSKPKPQLLSPLLAEQNVLFDLVVEIAHILARMSQPVLAETFGRVGVVPQESVSETPKRMVPALCAPLCLLTYFSFFGAG
jgi:hypothetical protein